MAQHDYNIANDTAANVRTDINNVLSAVASQNSGASAPSTTFANMLWYDTANNTLKMRNEADDAWISLFSLDQVGDTAVPSKVTIASQAEAEAGTENTKAMSALRVKQAIDTFAATSKNPFETLTTGTNVRSRYDTEIETTSNSYIVVHKWSFLQFGTVNVYYEQASKAVYIDPPGTTYNGSCQVIVTRTRNGIETTVSTNTLTNTSTTKSAFTARSVDVSVEPGDYVQIKYRNTIASGVAYIKNTRFRTNGENLWPGPGETVLIEGNTTT